MAKSAAREAIEACGNSTGRKIPGEPTVRIQMTMARFVALKLQMFWEIQSRPPFGNRSYTLDVLRAEPGLTVMIWDLRVARAVDRRRRQLADCIADSHHCLEVWLWPFKFLAIRHSNDEGTTTVLRHPVM